MQRVTAPPRQGLTVEQVRSLITGPAVTIDCGLELLDVAGQVTADLSEFLVPSASEVSWQAEGIHRTCRLAVTTSLQWWSARLRPYMIMQHGGVQARFNLGVYLAGSPHRDVDGAGRGMWTVDGFDKLEVLNTPIGKSWSVPAGTSYVAAVETLIGDIDPAPSPTIWVDGERDDTLPDNRIFEADANATYLSVANALLRASGRQELWADQDGNYRIGVHHPPTRRPAEWTYDTTSADTILHPDRSEEADWADVPNEWVFIVDRPAKGVPDGDDGLNGRLVVRNQSEGFTSIDARGGLVRRTIERLDAADAEALRAQADRIVAEQTRIVRQRGLTTDPNPLHSHDDICLLRDDTLAGGRALWRSWSLPLDGSPMRHEVEMI